jgi:hypothetical protein
MEQGASRIRWGDTLPGVFVVDLRLKPVRQPAHFLLRALQIGDGASPARRSGGLSQPQPQSRRVGRSSRERFSAPLRAYRSHAARGLEDDDLKDVWNKDV